jgi:hypothetical protein
MRTKNEPVDVETYLSRVMWLMPIPPGALPEIATRVELDGHDWVRCEYAWDLSHAIRAGLYGVALTPAGELVRFEKVEQLEWPLTRYEVIRAAMAAGDVGHIEKADVAKFRAEERLVTWVPKYGESGLHPQVRAKRFIPWRFRTARGKVEMTGDMIPEEVDHYIPTAEDIANIRF